MLDEETWRFRYQKVSLFGRMCLALLFQKRLLKLAGARIGTSNGEEATRIKKGAKVVGWTKRKKGLQQVEEERKREKRL